jgi:aldehyde:ferredoxin oxidoreductase
VTSWRGSRQFAAAFGAEEEAVQVNGLEVAYHDPRGVSGMALSYATSPRGACHNQSDYFFVDWGHTYDEIGIDFSNVRRRRRKPPMWRNIRIGARISTRC